MNKKQLGKSAKLQYIDNQKLNTGLF